MGRPGLIPSQVLLFSSWEMPLTIPVGYYTRLRPLLKHKCSSILAHPLGMQRDQPEIHDCSARLEEGNDAQRRFTKTKRSDQHEVGDGGPLFLPAHAGSSKSLSAQCQTSVQAYRTINR